MKQNNTTKKLALAGVLTALAIVGSFISVPVAGSKCAPVQHMVNILAAVTLGPAWGVGIAFCASLSGCFVSDGNCAGRTFRLCRSIPYFHCRRKHPCFHPDHSSGKRRRYVTDQRSIIIIHSYSTLL